MEKNQELSSYRDINTHVIGGVYVSETFLEANLVRSIKILNMNNSEAALHVSEFILWKHLCAKMYVKGCALKHYYNSISK